MDSIASPAATTPRSRCSNRSTGDPEAALLPLLRELGIGLVRYSPLGHGFHTGTTRSPEELADDDWRKTNTRFTEGSFEATTRRTCRPSTASDQTIFGKGTLAREASGLQQPCSN